MALGKFQGCFTGRGAAVNPCLILTRNNLELTKKAVESVYAQRLSHVEPWIVENGSNDGTREWAIENGIILHAAPYNLGVSVGWNCGLSTLFDKWKREHVLCIGNDTILPEWFYQELLSYDVPFVTGIAVDDMEAIRRPAQRMPLTPNPDYSAFLIKKEAWDKIGPFDERLVSYCGDCDHHLRGHRLGIGMWKANVPYFHLRSSTLNNASPRDRRVIQAQADADRARFMAMYGVIPGEPGYEELFK